MDINVPNGPANCRRYGSERRSVRRHQLSRRAHADAALDPVRRLADLVIAGVLIVIQLAPDAFCGARIKLEGSGLRAAICVGQGGLFS